MRLSSRAAAASESPTLALTARIKAMQAAGEPVIGFGAGEPDFDTPEHIKEAAAKAMAAGFTKYCPASGTVGLREAVCERLASDQGLTGYKPNQVIVGNGGKGALFTLFQALLNPGDAVFLPAPYWVSYLDQVRLAGGMAIILPTDESTGLKITPAQLAEAIETYPFARAMVLNSPSNPTGTMYSEAEIRALAEVLQATPDLVVVSDEIYDKLIYDGRSHFSIAQADGMRDRTVICNGVSKSYSMTGWRIGWAVGDAELIGAMGRIQSHDTSGPTSIAQVAAEAALRGPQECVEEMRQAFEQRRKLMVDGLRAIPGVTCVDPGGAFYAFPKVSALFRDGETVGAFSERLLDQAKVGVVPGDGFGAAEHVRLSYACSNDNIEQGLARIAEFARG